MLPPCSTPNDPVLRVGVRPLDTFAWLLPVDACRNFPTDSVCADLSVFRHLQFSLSPTKQPQDQERFKSSCTGSVAKHTKSEDSWSMFWCQSLHGSINFTVVVISCWWGHNICKASSWEQWTGDHCWRYRPSACTSPQSHAMLFIANISQHIGTHRGFRLWIEDLNNFTLHSIILSHTPWITKDVAFLRAVCLGFSSHSGLMRRDQSKFKHSRREWHKHFLSVCVKHLKRCKTSTWWCLFFTAWFDSR